MWESMDRCIFLFASAFSFRQRNSWVGIMEPTAFVKHWGIPPSVASKYQYLKIALGDYTIALINTHVELKLFAHLLLIVSSLPLISSLFGIFSAPPDDKNVSETGSHVCRKDEVPRTVILNDSSSSSSFTQTTFARGPNGKGRMLDVTFVMPLTM